MDDIVSNGNVLIYDTYHESVIEYVKSVFKVQTEFEFDLENKYFYTKNHKNIFQYVILPNTKYSMFIDCIKKLHNKLHFNIDKSIPIVIIYNFHNIKPKYHVYVHNMLKLYLKNTKFIFTSNSKSMLLSNYLLCLPLKSEKKQSYEFFERLLHEDCLLLLNKIADPKCNFTNLRLMFIDVLNKYFDCQLVLKTLTMLALKQYPSNRYEIIDIASKTDVMYCNSNKEILFIEYFALNLYKILSK